MSDVPPNYRAIAELVAGHVDDKLAENNHATTEILERIMAHIGQQDQIIAGVQATVGGLRDAVAVLQENAGESMPEHVYKQFIRSEAERLRIVKRVVKDDE